MKQRWKEKTREKYTEKTVSECETDRKTETAGFYAKCFRKRKR